MTSFNAPSAGVSRPLMTDLRGAVLGIVSEDDPPLQRRRHRWTCCHNSNSGSGNRSPGVLVAGCGRPAGRGSLADGGMGVIAGWGRRLRSRSRVRLQPVAGLAASDLSALGAFSRKAFAERLEEVCTVLDRCWAQPENQQLEAILSTDLLLTATAGETSIHPLRSGGQGLVATVVEASQTSRYQHVVVRVEGLGQDEVQFWTFERAAGPLVGASCPACGASLSLNERGQCSHCGAALDVPRSDWVLSRLETPAGWSNRQLDLDQSALEGLDAIRQADPEFDPEAFVERIRSAYPYLKQGWLEGTAAHPQTPGDFSPGPVPDAGSAVAGRSPMQVTICGAQYTHDRDDVTVHVECDVIEDEAGGEGTGAAGHSVHRHWSERWTLCRRASARLPESAVRADVCPGCGSPLELDDRGRCRYCEGAIVPEVRGWVLMSAIPVPPAPAPSSDDVPGTY